MAEHMLKWPAAQRYAQRFHRGEISGHPYTGFVLLRKVNLLVRALCRPPFADMTLKRTELARIILFRVLFPEPLKNRLRFEFRRLLKHHHDLIPVLDERIPASSPGT